jgi:hypothetical protein
MSLRFPQASTGARTHEAREAALLSSQTPVMPGI